MKINLKNLPKSAEELAKIILLQQQEIEKHKQEIISHKERYPAVNKLAYNAGY